MKSTVELLMNPFKVPQPNSTNTAPSTANFAWAHRPYWEQCERRLALSAMPWMPWDIGPQELQHVPAAADLHLPIASESANAGSCLAVDSNSPSVDSIAPPMQQQLSEAHAQTGWNQLHSQFGIAGKGQTVAVIDSGIAFDHVALGKGYGPGYKVVGGWDFAENDARPYDDAPAGFHGTHVAGIIGANDGVHLGVAPDVDLVALRVFNDTGKGEIAWAESALKWVHDNRNAFANPITTVNLSLGAAWNASTVPSWATLEEELAQLQRDGIVVVASAGNAFQKNPTPGLSYPAASPFVIPVSSVDANGQLSDFSQRDSRSIAAPGRSIESTVPDYFYGKDGINNDWANASGTSMAAPYMAGASVLVREAMEMVGIQNITPQSIYEQLHATSKQVWDSVTHQNYSVLDLDRAIESILPQDTVGDTFASAQATAIQSSWQTDGWINTLSDQDVYQLAPTQNGNVSLQLSSEYVNDSVFHLWRGGQETSIVADHGRLTFSVVAGESIGLSVADQNAIGPYHLNWTFAASAADDNNRAGGHDTLPSNVIQLGPVDAIEQTLAGTSRYQLTAEHTGVLTVVVDAGQTPTGIQTTGTLQLLRPGLANGTLTDSTLENNQWRIDVDVTEGQNVEVVLPGSSSRNVHVVNLLEKSGNQALIHGTEGSDRVSIDLTQGIAANIAGVRYQLDPNVIQSIVIHGGFGNDSLDVIGSAAAEKVEMRPGITTISNLQLAIQANSYENVSFEGGGGPDRAFLYDGETNDRLYLWPNKAEMTGVGYTYKLDHVERIFVNAEKGGDDQAFMFDSAGNDTLSVRPQFTSQYSDTYFNYVSGFEQVFAYASAGGVDRASLYDSQGDDLFNTSGENTSIVGPGFATFARGYSQVEAYASAGGNDRANVYASSSGHITSGGDYVGMDEGAKSSIARGFEQVTTYVAGKSIPLPVPASLSMDTSTLSIHADSMDAPIVHLRSEASTVQFQGVQATGPTPTPVFAPESLHDWITAVETESPVALQEQGPSAWPITKSSTQNSHAYASITAFPLSDLDISWIDPSHERAALDEIFADS